MAVTHNEARGGAAAASKKARIQIGVFQQLNKCFQHRVTAEYDKAQSCCILNTTLISSIQCIR